VVRDALTAFAESLAAEDAAKAVAAPAVASVDAIKAAAEMEKTSSGEAKLAHAAAFKKESEDAAELEKMRAQIAQLRVLKAARQDGRS
jgi:hypothetical protein